jgi:hypothetical protein
MQSQHSNMGAVVMVRVVLSNHHTTVAVLPASSAATSTRTRIQHDTIQTVVWGAVVQMAWVELVKPPHHDSRACKHTAITSTQTLHSTHGGQLC